MEKGILDASRRKIAGAILYVILCNIKIFSVHQHRHAIFVIVYNANRW